MPTRKQNYKARNKSQKHHRSLQEKPTHEVGCRGQLFSSAFVPKYSSSSSHATRRSCAFRDLACTSAPDVYVPATAASVVRASADWEVKRARCKKTPVSSRSTNSVNFVNSRAGGVHKFSSSSSTALRAGKKKMAVVVQPGLGCSGRWSLTADFASVECFVPTEHVSVSRRTMALKSCRKASGDGGRTTEEHSCPLSARRFDGVAQQGLDVTPGPSASETTQSAVVALPRRRVRNVQGWGQSAVGDISQELLINLSELGIYDQFWDWRLDVDDMSYEDLVELGDRIGYVKTGLREEEITGCLDKLKCLIQERQGQCSICQEEYNEGGELGKLKCGHRYHVNCIRDWLLQRSVCPLCKVSVAKSIPS